MRMFLAILFFLLPLVWSKYLNANYLSTKTFLLYLGSALALLALPDKLNLRQIPKTLYVLLAAVFVYYIGFVLWDFTYFNFLFLFKMLSFVILTLYFYSLNLKSETLFKNLGFPFFLMWLVIIGFTGYEVFTLRVLQLNVKTDVILSTFGNINMFSEFAVLSLPLLLAWSRFSDRIPLGVKLVCFSLVMFLVLYGRSRSALLGLVLWAVFKTYQGFKKGEWVAVAAAVFLFSLSHFTAPDTTSISKFVPTAFSERASLYHASLEMLKDRPMGSRPGQFVNDIVPYLLDKPTGPNEFAYFDQPHSEFLKWGIQFGWPMLVLALLLTLLIFSELVKRYRAAPSLSGSLPLETFLILLPEMAFQFPFENPATILLLSFVFGLYLSSYARGRSLRLRWLKPFLGALAFLGIANAFLFLNSIALESLFPKSPDLMDVTCASYPLNFRTCYWKNKDLLEARNIEAFRNSFKADYLQYPFFCDNLRLLPEYFNQQKNEKKTCEALLLYGFIYRNQKNFTPATMDLCRNYSLPVPFHSPAQFDADFRKWFQSN